MVVWFRYALTVRDYSISRAVEFPAAPLIDPVSGVTVQLLQREGGNESHDLRAVASTSRAVSEELAETLGTVWEGRPSKRGPWAELSIVADDAGVPRTRIVPGLTEWPAQVQELFDGTREQMRAAIDRTVSILRWRGGVAHGRQHNLYSALTSEFSMDDAVSWRKSPSRLSVLSLNDFWFPLPFSSDVYEFVTTTPLPSEPTSRQLFREAWALRFSAPNAALTIGCAAAEVGCKEFIGVKIPDAAWLVQEAPTPPVAKILKNYIPTFSSASDPSGTARIPDACRKQVGSAFEDRNRVVHRGSAPLGSNALVEHLRAINDLLWILDFHAGHSWALRYVSHSTRAELSPEDTSSE